MARLRATEPDQRLGSLVFNFGGPGDAGTETLPGLRRADPRRGPSPLRPRELRSPRHRQVAAGRVHRRRHRRPAQRGRSHPELRRRPARVLRRHPRARRPRRALRRQNGAWLAQLGSRNVARDLDRLRAALGEDTLSFVGYSYGTVIGSVYAQMFPDRVGRMVLDSPVDLSADALDELRGNSQGFEQALDDFLADCAKRPACSFHSGGDPTERPRHPRTSVRTGPRAPDRRPRHREEVEAQGRRRRVLHRADLRALRPPVRLARARRRARPTPAPATAATCSRSPTSTTAATTTAPTTTSTRSSA